MVPLSRWMSKWLSTPVTPRTARIAEISPIDLFPDTLPHLLAPLLDPATQLPEAIHYGLARSIVDGREYFSRRLLKRTLEGVILAIGVTILSWLTKKLMVGTNAPLIATPVNQSNALVFSIAQLTFTLIIKMK